MNGTARHYFARGNTARGAHFLYGSAFQGLSKLVLLQGPSGTGKSTAIERLAYELIAQGQSIQLFHSPIQPNDLDALIATDLNIGVADANACEGLPLTESAAIVRLDFGQAVNYDAIAADNGERIDALREQLVDAYSKAYGTFAEALRIHDDWEKVYIASMNFQKADQVAKELAQTLFAEPPGKNAVIRHLFFGAATPKGAVDHIQNLTASLDKRIFIKGRPGSGKSTMLKYLARAAETSGFDAEVFHCGFDPNSLDMLIFPELRTAIFDSTAPHEYFPDRRGDVILDMYERTMLPGTDERYADEIEPLRQRYSQKMKEATAFLGEAQKFDARIKEFYTEATDFSLVRTLQTQLEREFIQS
ncbi:hypothetical protein [Paenibacillus ginsengarvi]|uniref:NACHT domain-containing protein n=1 Tax=Paenibacillus ginsengarvi TaxID=400777 RepID=A0A3B0CBH9_9BACL|nr:hypothetical protein [Paenibacillus ginsengarvi]RKN83795.1 hypothetical protein D7M11_16500 [Paenibacillus ginsengarvi]